MNNIRPEKIILILSISLSILIIFSSLSGILITGFYKAEFFNWQVQSRGQDYIDLLIIVPILLLSAIFSSKKNNKMNFIWAGTILYLIYTFLIYCFDVQFNMLFPVYCIILGISFYSIIYYFHSLIKETIRTEFREIKIIKITGIYFLVISVLFYALWLSEILPAIFSHSIPQSLADVGLPANPVHVIDLSVFLPGVFITGILLLRKKYSGIILAPMILTFFILMDVTIGTLNILMMKNGLTANATVGIIMAALAVFSALLLFPLLNRMNNHQKI